MNERLRLFLYLLVRDDLPSGRVERLLKETAAGMATGRPEYSSRLIAALAAEWAERLEEE